MPKAKRIHTVRPAGQMAARIPQIMQMEALECGAASLAMVCAYYGKWIPLEQVRGDCGVSRDGSSALNIVKAARRYGFDARGYRMEPESLASKAVFPCIVHWSFNHFVVVRGIKNGTVYLNDPARGEVKISMEEFDRGFTGVCLQLVPTEDFQPGGEPTSVKDFALERLHGAKAALAFVAITAAITSLLGIVNPALSQIFTDRLLTGENPGWLIPFMAVLAAMALVQVTVSALNAVYLLRVEGKMAVSSNASFMWKVLHLPMEFFSQRMAGDIVSRAATNAGIAQSVVGTLAPLLINAVMLVVYLVIMVTYSPLLAAVGIASSAINIFVARLISAKRVNITRVQMRDQANLASATMAGISMVETLKAAGAEAGFFRRWSGYQASANTQAVKVARLGQYLGLVPQLVNTASSVAVLVIGVWLIIGGHFTTGMLLAFQGYLAQFSAPAQSFIGSMQLFQEMRTDMERIKDVMDYPSDPLAIEGPGVQKGGSPAPDAGASEEDDEAAAVSVALPFAADGLEKLRGNVRMEGVSFGYSPLADPLIKDFCLDVPAGSSVAFVGPSGCGKSTLSKLISGLYRPWEGRILFDGKPLEDVPRAVRCGSIAVIDQDIVLFNDTIANNIRLWDESIEDFEVVLAARDARIHDDIMERDDGYDHVLAEGGRDFSGGQRQRLEIARALSMDPTVLIMDEATSALDAKTEAEVVNAIKKRGITCIVIAHRLSAVRDCDEIVVLDQGKVVERGTHEQLYAAGGMYARLVSQE